jgi:hypothetical protein
MHLENDSFYLSPENTTLEDNMQDGLQAMVARIDERTEHIQTDVAELKVNVKQLSETVNSHTEKLGIIKQRLDNQNNYRPMLTRKQKISTGGAIVAFVAAVIAAIIEYFKHH